MLHFLKNELPADIISLIAQFEGRIVEAYLREYVSQIYSRAIQAHHGGYNNLEHITSPSQYFRLPFFSKWATTIRKTHIRYVKKRKCRKFMREFHGIIPPKLLDKIRVQIECCPKNYTMGKYGWKTIKEGYWTYSL